MSTISVTPCLNNRRQKPARSKRTSCMVSQSIMILPESDALSSRVTLTVSPSSVIMQPTSHPLAVSLNLTKIPRVRSCRQEADHVCRIRVKTDSTLRVRVIHQLVHKAATQQLHQRTMRRDQIANCCVKMKVNLVCRKDELVVTPNRTNDNLTNVIHQVTNRIPVVNVCPRDPSFKVLVFLKSVVAQVVKQRSLLSRCISF